MVSLRIIDFSGREVRTLVNREKQKGTYNIEFDATGLLSGIYLIRICITSRSM
jgi:hypothetical protein